MHTPLITGSDCEGAGEMFQVTTMDMNNIPTDDKGNVDYCSGFLWERDKPDCKRSAEL